MLPDNDNITFECMNRFDEGLLQTYLAYKNDNHDDRVRGSQATTRIFVWNSTRFNQTFNDTAEFFQFYVENMSDGLQAAFGARPSDLNRRFQDYDEQEKTKELSKCILDKLKLTKLRKCLAFNSLATRENEIVSWPHYIFLRDESVPTGAKEMLTFPTSLEFSDDKTYYIQGRVNSFARTGHHFTSVAVIPDNGNLFLAEIDNMAHTMNIIKTEDRLHAEMVLIDFK
ncbi:hypothetical protein INT45_002749 [Circinella minor]|uniref:Uncharacterized protein n=1 Tax=Circinella minor TaxID=1195481 RepID=A0A8H7S2X0_9FUNG|nr:hypothetical protein INT45_002749 [Circinella minor]